MDTDVAPRGRGRKSKAPENAPKGPKALEGKIKNPKNHKWETFEENADSIEKSAQKQALKFEIENRQKINQLNKFQTKEFAQSGIEVQKQPATPTAQPNAKTYTATPPSSKMARGTQHGDSNPSNSTPPTPMKVAGTALVIRTNLDRSDSPKFGTSSPAHLASPDLVLSSNSESLEETSNFCLPKSPIASTAAKLPSMVTFNPTTPSGKASGETSPIEATAFAESPNATARIVALEKELGESKALAQQNALRKETEGAEQIRSLFNGLLERLDARENSRDQTLKEMTRLHQLSASKTASELANLREITSLNQSSALKMASELASLREMTSLSQSSALNTASELANLREITSLNQSSALKTTSELAQVANGIKTLTEATETTANSISPLRTSIDWYQSTVTSLRKGVDDLVSANTTTIEKIDQVSSDFHTIMLGQKNIEKKIVTLDQELSDISSTVKCMEPKVDANTEQLRILEQKVVTMQKTISLQEETIKSHESLRDEIALLKQGTASILELKKEFENIKNAVTANSDDVRDVLKKQESFLLVVDKSTKDIASLEKITTPLVASLKKIDSVAVTVTSNSNDVQALKSDLRALTQVVDTSTIELTTMRKSAGYVKLLKFKLDLLCLHSKKLITAITIIAVGALLLSRFSQSRSTLDQNDSSVYSRFLWKEYTRPLSVAHPTLQNLPELFNTPNCTSSVYISYLPFGPIEPQFLWSQYAQPLRQPHRQLRRVPEIFNFRNCSAAQYVSSEPFGPILPPKENPPHEPVDVSKECLFHNTDLLRSSDRHILLHTNCLSDNTAVDELCKMGWLLVLKECLKESVTDLALSGNRTTIPVPRRCLINASCNTSPSEPTGDSSAMMESPTDSGNVRENISFRDKVGQWLETMPRFFSSGMIAGQTDNDVLKFYPRAMSKSRLDIDLSMDADFAALDLSSLAGLY